MPNPTTELRYQTGFGNQFATEAVPGALPQGRNSPQRPAHGLYAELISGSAFTAPRADNRRTWLYRRQPSVVSGRYQPYAQPHWLTGAASGQAAPPDPMRWHPIAVPAAEQQPLDFVDGLRSIVVNGDPDAQTGMAAHLALMNRSMEGRALVNADAEMLILPQQGALRVVTELGILEARPGEVLLLPRGIAFSVQLMGQGEGEGTAWRAYVCENHGAPFRLPELGPIGSNGLANPRDFRAPVAAYENPQAAAKARRRPPRGMGQLGSGPALTHDAQQDQPFEIIRRYGGQCWRTQQARTPFDVVAWHGNLAPMVYDTAAFMVIGSISFDHPDPSIFTVLTSPSDTPGVANCDFVIFPPRWMVAEDTFRPPWYHRNLMSEFMGLVHGQYDAKPDGFKPGGMSLHNCMVPHGPDAEAFGKASSAALAPHKLDHTLAFMFESRWRFKPTAFALGCGALDTAYADCWQGLADHHRST